MPYLRELLLVLAAYALGSISTGYYLVRLRTGGDIRRLGSGSTGSRNVARTVGLGASAITLVGDTAKGATVVGAALILGLEDWAVLLVVAAVVAGHVWPPQLGFQGGKGLATVMGAVLVIDFRLVLIAYLVAAITLGLTRRVTLGGFVAVGLTPMVAVLMGHSDAGVIGLFLLAALIFFTHRGNVQSVLRDTLDVGRKGMTEHVGLIGGKVSKPPAPLTFKVASEGWEFEQIHRLNYETFVEEIPQHEGNAEKSLVDAFHGENTYFICLRDGRLLGMVASRDRRPFSLDRKLRDLDSHLSRGKAVCEIRLLSVAREHRNGRVMRGLLTALARHCVDRGYDVAIISGNVRQERLYRRLGFVPFGPRVGTAEALYQPMYRELATLEEDLSDQSLRGHE